MSATNIIRNIIPLLNETNAQPVDKNQKKWPLIQSLEEKARVKLVNKPNKSGGYDIGVNVSGDNILPLERIVKIPVSNIKNSWTFE